MFHYSSLKVKDTRQSGVDENEMLVNSINNCFEEEFKGTHQLDKEDSDESDKSENGEDEEDQETITGKGKKRSLKLKKPGRKARWSDSLVDDLVDVITNDEYYRKKLIFTNTKNQKNGPIYSKILQEIEKRAATRNEPVPFTAVQLRNKFKKLVGDCKKAALTIKTATGIQRFQDDKGYGQWFSQLYALIKTRDSCQPEQAIEPSSSETSSASKPDSDSSGTSKDACGTKLFVPVKGNKGKKKNDPLQEAVNAIKNALEKDPVKDLLAFMREEDEKSRQHDMMVLQMLLQQPTSQQAFAHTTPQTTFSHPTPQTIFSHPMPQSPQVQSSHATYMPLNTNAIQPPVQLSSGYVANAGLMVGANPAQPINQYSPQGEYYNAENESRYHSL